MGIGFGDKGSAERVAIQKSCVTPGLYWEHLYGDVTLMDPNTISRHLYKVGLYW